MAYSIVYLPKASEDYKSAVRWYHKHSVMAAENFEQAMEAQISVIKNQPDRFRKTYKEFREARLKRFPFSILYLIDEKQQHVVVAGVFHHKRNPEDKFSSR